MFDFLLQWPTLITLAMFPVLVWMYARLAKAEEREAMVEFGAAYRQSMQTRRLLFRAFEATGEQHEAAKDWHCVTKYAV